MRKIFHLSTCTTCKRIISSINLNNIELIDIKQHNITGKDLDFAASKTGGYESLFNKRAQKLKLVPDSEKPITDQDFRKLILEEYTFLKRPLAIIDEDIYAGNSRETIQKLKSRLENPD